MCTIEKLEGDKAFIAFDQEVRAVTPGQAVVFYRENTVLGGGTIVRGRKKLETALGNFYKRNNKGLLKNNFAFCIDIS